MAQPGGRLSSQSWRVFREAWGLGFRASTVGVTLIVQALGFLGWMCVRIPESQLDGLG